MTGRLRAAPGVPPTTPPVPRDAGAVDQVGGDWVVAPLNAAHVLLPLDGSSFALAALRTARALSRRLGARLVTISVAPDEREADRLQRHVGDALGGRSGVDDAAVAVSSDPAEAIARRSEELAPSVVCMSTRGRGRVTGAVLGSVARSVVRSSRSPVVVVGPNADRPGSLVGRPPRPPRDWAEPLSGSNVIACVDGSPHSEEILPAAARWAVALDMGLRILTVAEDAPADVGGDRPNRFGPRHPQQYVDGLAEQWRERVPSCVGEVVLDPLSVASGLRSHPAAGPGNLIVLGTQARTGLDRVRLGSTAADILRTSAAPALVVPTFESDIGGEHGEERRASGGR